MDFSNYVNDNMYYVVNWHYTIDLMVGMFLRKVYGPTQLTHILQWISNYVLMVYL